MIEEFPLFIFTSLGGMAAGAYIFAAFFKPNRETAVGKQGWLLPLICLVLLGISGLMLLTHLGHPERFLNAFANPSAGITLEGYTMAGFAIVALIDMIIGFTGKQCPQWLRVIGAIFAALLISAMSYAYFTSYGVIAWASWQTILLFVFGNCAMGFALALALGYTGQEYSDAESKGSVGANIVVLILEAFTAIALFLEGAYFAAVGLDMIWFIVGAILVIIALILNWFGMNKKSMGINWIAFCCVAVGVIIARYSFYTAFIG